jgi:hypothetical protein
MTELSSLLSIPSAGTGSRTNCPSNMLENPPFYHICYSSIFLIGGILCLIALLPALLQEEHKTSSAFVCTMNSSESVDADHCQEDHNF